MCTETITIRNAVREDAELLGKVILAAAHVNDFPAKSEFDECTTEICSREDTLYSFRHARMICIGGVPVGAMICYPGDIYQQAREITFPLFIDSTDESIAATGTEAFPGEWYLDSLAILPAYRKYGLGKTLILDGIEIGKKAGYSKFSLIVEKSSPELQSFYASFGFERKEELLFFGAEYYRMVMTA